jgi:hypothetical protein
MSEDFFTQVDWFSEKFGAERPQTDAEIVDRFALHGPEHRIAILSRVETERDGSELGLAICARPAGSRTLPNK